MIIQRAQREVVGRSRAVGPKVAVDWEVDVYVGLGDDRVDRKLQERV